MIPTGLRRQFYKAGLSVHRRIVQTVANDSDYSFPSASTYVFVVDIVILGETCRYSCGLAVSSGEIHVVLRQQRRSADGEVQELCALKVQRKRRLLRACPKRQRHKHFEYRTIVSGSSSEKLVSQNAPTLTLQRYGSPFRQQYSSVGSKYACSDQSP
jgi:hypothetical protein